MAESLIQKFLNAGMFNIGDDDERLSYFQKAADDLANHFKNFPTKFIAATLVAIDSNVPANEPLLIEAELAVKTHWKAFANKYPARPIGLLRPVILEALAQRANEDQNSANIIWLSGSNLVEHVEQTKETAIVVSFLKQCGDKMESEAAKIWDSPIVAGEFTAPRLTFKLTAPKAVRIEHTKLKQQFQEHPSNYNGISASVAEPIADAIEASTAPLYEHAASLTDQIKTPLKDFSRDFGPSLASWVNGLIGTHGRKLELLWWKQCFYSPTMQRSYRGLIPAAMAIALAEDLKRLCPNIAPQSLEYFLRETIKDCLGKNPEITLGELLLAAKDETGITKVLEPAALPANPQRICLLTAVRSARQMLPEPKAFPAWLGASSNLKLPVTEWAVWLFRDAQALSLSASAAIS